MEKLACPPQIQISEWEHFLHVPTCFPLTDIPTFPSSKNYVQIVAYSVNVLFGPSVFEDLRTLVSLKALFKKHLGLTGKLRLMYLMSPV